jgi:hypothetical protein
MITHARDGKAVARSRSDELAENDHPLGPAVSIRRGRRHRPPFNPTVGDSAVLAT